MSILSILKYHLEDRLVDELPVHLHARMQRVNERFKYRSGFDLHHFARRLPALLRGAWAQSKLSSERQPIFRAGTAGAVLLVPGMFASPVALSRLGKALEANGYSVLLPRVFDPGWGPLSNTCRLEAAARQLLNDLADYKQAGIMELSMLAHSSGGLISLMSLEMAETEGRAIPKLHRLITLASPLGGAPIARNFKHFVPACQDVVPGAEILSRLSKRMAGIDLACVAAKDSLVPEERQVGPGTRSYRFPDFNHFDFHSGTQIQLDQVVAVLQAELNGSVQK